PSLELFERGEALYQFGLRVRDLLLGGVRVRKLRSLLQDEPLVYHHVERATQVLLPWAVERHAGLKRQLPEQVRVGYQPVAVHHRDHSVNDLSAALRRSLRA